MALNEIRKNYQKGSPAAKAVRKPATKGRFIGYLLFGLASIGLAIWLFAGTGNGTGAMLPLVVGVIALFVAYSQWSQLKGS